MRVTKSQKQESQRRRRFNDVKWGTRNTVQTKRQAEKERAYLKNIGAVA